MRAHLACEAVTGRACGHPHWHVVRMQVLQQPPRARQRSYSVPPVATSHVAIGGGTATSGRWRSGLRAGVGPQCLSPDILQLSVLWCAHVTESDGSVHGAGLRATLQVAAGVLSAITSPAAAARSIGTAPQA
jgi:hypothetical protein